MPEHFADKLLELEASLEFEATMETIKELNDLYRVRLILIIGRHRLLHLK